MYSDSQPCRVCGSDVELRPPEEPAGKTEPDGPVDERICTNPSCPTNSGAGQDRP